MHPATFHGFRPFFFLLTLALSLLAACSPVGPDYQMPQPEIPARWSEAANLLSSEQTNGLGRWWSLFRDPLLDALIHRAIAANLDLRIAETRIREARAQYRFTSASGLPTVGAGASYTDSRSNERGNGRRDSQGLFQAQFDAGWEIDFFGGVRRQVEAADALLAAAIEDRRDVLVSLTADVARGYLDVRINQHRLGIARDNSHSQQQTVDLVRNKLHMGLGNDLELAQAQSQLAQTTAQMPGLESDTIQAMHRLAILLGQQPQTLKTKLAAPGAPLPVPPQLPAVLPSELLRQRPDIRGAERQLAAATATVGAATAGLFPRFSLNALVGLQSSSLNDLVTGSSRFWSAGPVVQWPLFDGGKARATLEISEARRARAQLFYEKTVLSALAEVENGLVALDRERTSQQSLTEAVAASQRAVQIARGQYQAGLTPFLNVLQSEGALYLSQDRLAQSHQRLALAMIALYKALGGGWQDPAAVVTTVNSNDSQPPKTTP